MTRAKLSARATPKVTSDSEDDGSGKISNDGQEDGAEKNGTGELCDDTQRHNDEKNCGESSKTQAQVQSQPQPQSQDFDDFAKDWWNPKGRLRSLHKITPLRFNYFNDKATELLGGLKGKRVLDIGCGGGLLSERFARAGAIVSGIDISTTSIQVAKDHAKAEGLKIDYEATRVADKVKGHEAEFDCVVCSEVLEHVDDLKGFVAESCKALKPGGLFFFSTINKTFKAKFFAIYVVEDLLGVLPQGTHDSEKFVRPSTLALMMEENSVLIEELKGMSFSPLIFSFKISKDTSINYLGFGVKSQCA